MPDLAKYKKVMRQFLLSIHRQNLSFTAWKIPETFARFNMLMKVVQVISRLKVLRSLQMAKKTKLEQRVQSCNVRNYRFMQTTRT